MTVDGGLAAAMVNGWITADGVIPRGANGTPIIVAGGVPAEEAKNKQTNQYKNDIHFNTTDENQMCQAILLVSPEDAEFLKLGGKTLGISNPLSLAFINLQAMLNSVKSSLPSEFTSASSL